MNPKYVESLTYKLQENAKALRATAISYAELSVGLRKFAEAFKTMTEPVVDTRIERLDIVL